MWVKREAWTVKSSQGPVTFVIGCWTHPGTTTVYTKEKMSKWPWSSQVPKRHTLRPTWSMTWPNMFCRGRGNKGAWVKKPRTHGKEILLKPILLMIFFGGREDEDKRRQKNYLTWIFFKTALFRLTLKTSAHSLFGAWSFLLVHIRITPSEGPKTLQIDFASNRTMKVGP